MTNVARTVATTQDAATPECTCTADGPALHTLAAHYAVRSAYQDQTTVDAGWLSKSAMANGFDALLAAYLEAHREDVKLEDVALAICAGIARLPGQRRTPLAALAYGALAVRDGYGASEIWPHVRSFMPTLGEPPEDVDELVLSLLSYMQRGEYTRPTWAYAFETVGRIAETIAAHGGHPDLLREIVLATVEYIEREVLR